MSFPRYPKYKASGVEWLGDVPEHWNVVPFPYAVHFQEGPGIMASDFRDEGVPLLRVSGAQGRWATLEGCNYLDPTLVEKRWDHFRLNRGDLVISASASMGTVCEVDDSTDGAIPYTGLIRLVGKAGVMTKDFVRSMVESSLFSVQIELLKAGTTIQHFGPTHLQQVKALRPPLAEQTKIASFLDRETSKIDGLVGEQRRLIELLKEKRQAVISHAVTKGLNPHAPLKPSGIEWLGDVPESWEVTPLKHLCVLLKDGTHLPPERVDDGVPLLSVRNLVDGKFVVRDDDSMISDENYQELCRPFVPNADDVLLAIVGATLGKTAIIPSGLGPFHIQRSLAIFRTRPEVIQPTFLNLVFQSHPFQSLLWELVGYSAQPGIYLGTLQNLRIPVPPLADQLRILELISARVNELTDLTAEAERGIELLQERRTALISAAVTGQIDVRGLVETEAA